MCTLKESLSSTQILKYLYDDTFSIESPFLVQRFVLPWVWERALEKAMNLVFFALRTNLRSCSET